jgi:hypothetical protein
MKAGVDKIGFAWAGGLERGMEHYYRIQAPTFLIEYDNTQNDANHVHSVWRDFENDFGVDLLRKHYETATAEHGHSKSLYTCREAMAGANACERTSCRRSSRRP